jgi:transcriptional regulator with XRE-family HTH domain
VNVAFCTHGRVTFRFMADNPDDTPQSDDQGEPWAEIDEGEYLTLRSALGANIRRLRAKRGWTQEALAEEMDRAGFDWSRVTVAQSENEIGSAARSRRVTIEELIGLAMVLRTTVLELLEHGPISVGGTFLNRDDLIAHLVGGTEAFAPEELTLLTKRAVATAEIQRLANERRDLDQQIADVRADKEDQ